MVCRPGGFVLVSYQSFDLKLVLVGVDDFRGAVIQ